jgi:hypothetical protein
MSLPLATPHSIGSTLPFSGSSSIIHPTHHVQWCNPANSLGSALPGYPTYHANSQPLNTPSYVNLSHPYPGSVFPFPPYGSWYNQQAITPSSSNHNYFQPPAPYITSSLGAASAHRQPNDFEPQGPEWESRRDGAGTGSYDRHRESKKYRASRDTARHLDELHSELATLRHAAAINWEEREEQIQWLQFEMRSLKERLEAVLSNRAGASMPSVYTDPARQRVSIEVALRLSVLMLSVPIRCTRCAERH